MIGCTLFMYIFERAEVIQMRKLLVFTDLDGTLIDRDTYEFKDASSALSTLRQRKIPVIICSSKTRAEVEMYRRRMNLPWPFVVENGAAIFIPQNLLRLKGLTFASKGEYRVIELGTPYVELCAIWEKTKKEGNFRVKGFSEMSTAEIAALTGLTTQEASLAARREYSEPFLFFDTQDRFRHLQDLFQQKGLYITRGDRFYHLTGKNDKGKAVQILKKIYADTYPDTEIWAVGLGDGSNDVPMLGCVDMPIVIRKKTGQWERIPGLGRIVYSDKPGPRGWAEEIYRILGNQDHVWS